MKTIPMNRRDMAADPDFVSVDKAATAARIAGFTIKRDRLSLTLHSDAYYISLRISRDGLVDGRGLRRVGITP